MTIKKDWLLLLLASIILSLAVPLALGGLSQFRLLSRISVGVVLLLISLKLISWAFNALRIKVLAGLMGKEMRLGEAALTTISAEFAGVTTPGAIGMAATYAFLFNRLGLAVGTAAGIVGLIMVTDLAVYDTILSLTAILQIFQPAALHAAVYLALLTLLFIGGTAGLLWFLVRHHRRGIRFTWRQMARISWLNRRRWSVGRATVEFRRTVGLLGQMTWFQRTALFLITLDFWLPRFLLLVIIVDLMAPNVPFLYRILIQGVLHLGGQASFIPSGVGVEDGIYAAFMSYFMGTESIAFSLVIWRFYSFYWYLFLGGPIFLYKVGKAAFDLLSKRT